MANEKNRWLSGYNQWTLWERIQEAVYENCGASIETIEELGDILFDGYADRKILEEVKDVWPAMLEKEIKDPDQAGSATELMAAISMMAENHFGLEISSMEELWDVFFDYDKLIEKYRLKNRFDEMTPVLIEKDLRKNRPPMSSGVRYRCPCCHAGIRYKANYCHNCGKRITFLSREELEEQKRKVREASDRIFEAGGNNGK